MWACSYAAAEIIVGPRRLLIALRLSLDRPEKGDHVPALLHIVHLKQHGMLHFPAIDLVKEGFGIADILEQSVVGPRDILGVGADHALGIFGEVGSAARRRSVYFVTSVRLIVEQIHLVGRRRERRIGRAIEKRLS